jgi:hypothetical protein
MVECSTRNSLLSFFDLDLRDPDRGKDSSMSAARRPPVSVPTLILAAVLVAGPGGASAQEAGVDVPANAFPTSSYGRGWACQRGYKMEEQACVAIHVPENAYLDSLGDRWRCDRGYSKVADGCLAIEVPPNAYLNAAGNAWLCERGYREVAETCLVIQVPTNGFLTDSSYGTGWACDRGYRAVDDDCIAMQLPENAHLDYLGHGWDCDAPYRRRGDRCALPSEAQQ